MSNKGVIGNVNLNGNTYSIASTLAAICSTLASYQVKTASVVNCPSGAGTDFTLIDGMTISVLFENANTAQNPTLNINNSGAKPIYKFNTTDSVTWDAGTTLNLTYFAASGKTGWWVNGEYKEPEQVDELYKITITSSNNSYSSDKDYEEILAAYTANKYIYVVYGSLILPLVSVNDQGTYSKFNFEVFDSTGYAHISIYGSDGHQAGEIDTDIDYEYIDLSYSPSFDDVALKITATLSGTTWSINKTYSQINTAYSANKYIYIQYTDGQDIYNVPLVSLVSQTFHFESLNNGRYIHFEVYLDGSTTKVSYEEVSFITNVKIDNSSVVSGSEANINTSSSHPYNASSNVLATMGDISAINVGATDVQVNGTSILSSGVANLITNTAYNASSNKLATMSDIGAAGGGTVTSVTAGAGLNTTSNDTSTDGGSITTSGSLYLTKSGVTAGTYSGVITVDKYGRVTSANNTLPEADEITYTPEDQGWQVSDVSGALDSLRLSSDGFISDIKVNSTSQTVTSHSVNITVPTKVSDLTNDSGFTSNTGTVTSIIAGTGLTGGTITSSGTIALDTSGVTAGTYQGITVDSYGRVTAATNQGYTSNTGTITGITMNGSSKGTSGVVDLGTVLTSYTETDPTVPSWAKASSKPTYTASEVGALPDSTTIPSKTSDLTNDSGFITTSAFSNTYSTTGLNFAKTDNTNRCTVVSGGYLEVGKWVLVNMYLKIDVSLGAGSTRILIHGLPDPNVAYIPVNISTTAPQTYTGLTGFIRNQANRPSGTSYTGGQLCIYHTAALDSSAYIMVNCLYTVA